MRNTQTYRWMISGALAVGVLAATPFVARAERDEDRSIDLKEAPHEVVRTVEENSRDQKISELDHIHHDGADFFRAIVRIHEHTVRDIRVAPDGALIGMDDFTDYDYRDRERDKDKEYWEHHH